MTDQIIQRASLLIQTRRYEEAMRELRNILTREPNHAYALALMGVSSTELGKHDEALNYIQQALGQTPDNPYFLYLMGLVYTRKDKLKEATKFVQSAINFDPHNADYFGLLAMIKLDEKLWEDALTFANRGLQVDPENLVCLNSRSTALLKLDRKEESYETIKEALSNDPRNSHTHSNLGWGLLEQGDHKRALESFREALKLDPENDHAKAGMVEALKARYWFYRVFLKYMFWIRNKNAKYQWVFIFGIYIGIRFLAMASKDNPTLALIATPLIYLYSAFALSSWIVVPVSNLLLRLNVYGRYALDRDQMRASTFVGTGAIITILGIVYAIMGGSFIMLIVGFGSMMMLGSMFNPSEPNKRKTSVGLASALCVCGLLAIALDFTGNDAGIFWQIFLFGVIAYQFILNALVTR